jgi:hypothetical protein
MYIIGRGYGLRVWVGSMGLGFRLGVWAFGSGPGVCVWGMGRGCGSRGITRGYKPVYMSQEYGSANGPGYGSQGFDSVCGVGNCGSAGMAGGLGRCLGSGGGSRGWSGGWVQRVEQGIGQWYGPGSVGIGFGHWVWAGGMGWGYYRVLYVQRTRPYNTPRPFPAPYSSTNTARGSGPRNDHGYSPMPSKGCERHVITDPLTTCRVYRYIHT